MKNSTAWVTFVKNDEEVLKALLLLKSMKAAWTTKPFFVLTGKNISDSALANISKEFDGTFPLEVPKHALDTNEELCAKIQCFKMTIFDQLIFLSPRLFILENIDYEFEKDLFTGYGSYEMSSSDIEILDNLNAFRIKPSVEIYSVLKKVMLTNTKILHTEVKATPWTVLESVAIEQFQHASSNSKQKCKIVNCGNFSPDKILETLSQICGLDFNLLRSNMDAMNIPLEVGKKEPIAIVGIACRLPGANNHDEFWNNLMTKKDSIVDLPNDRWLPEQGCSIVPDRKKIHAGFLSCPVDEVDGKFFGISPKEMEFTDPQQRFLLEVSWEALEDAAIDPSSLKGSNTGIFTGTWTQDYHDLIINNGKDQKEFFRGYLGTAYGATAGRLAYFYGTMGSNVATESGCSSSIVAVGLACKSLQNRSTNLGLACGVNILLKPFCPVAMESFTSPDGHSKAFDASADGFGRAEGCGVLVLKRLSDAIRDGNRIHALIRGYGEAQEGTSKSLGTPTVECEALAMTTALQDANMKPEDVQYVEAHGTGTPVGDPMEMNAITQVYGKKSRSPLYVGSVKANVGHTESCSGITGIIKTVMALEHKTIPPHRGLQTLNPKINLEAIPAIIPQEAVAWVSPAGKPRVAGVSSFGITGTDAHIILQEAPTFFESHQPEKNPQPSNILLLSAKSDSALDEKLKKYETFLQNEPSSSLNDIAFTNNIGRAHLNHRIAVVGKDSKEIASKLASGKFLQESTENKTTEKPKICFLFTGQGSQYPGMAKQLYSNFPIFQKYFDACDDILRTKYNINIRKALWDFEEDTELIKNTLYSQTSIFCVEYCISQIWKHLGIIPSAVLGHSLGEFAAACCADIISLEDAIKLVAERSKLIDSLDEGSMLVVKADEEVALSICIQLPSNIKSELDIAATNTSDQTVLAGSKEAVDSFKQMCLNNNIKSTLLDSKHAFHSSQMDAILDKYKKVADTVKVSNEQACQYISGVTGTLLKHTNDMDSTYWIRHTRDRVKFIEASAVAISLDCNVFIEVGPQPILSSFILSNIGSSRKLVTVPSLRKGQNDVETLLTGIGRVYTLGMDVNLKPLYDGLDCNIVSIPHYPFQRKKVWFELSTNNNSRSLNSGTGKHLHPLLGHSFPTAAQLKVFQSCISPKEETYIKDHVVGSHIIFPAAGYIEMALAAGNCSTLASFEDFRLPYGPITIKNLVVESPLGMKEEQFYDIQTLVETEEAADEGWNTIKIFRREGISSEAQKWVRHSSSKFTSVVNPSEQYLSESKEDLQKFIKSAKHIAPNEFYESLKTCQLNFGETFRSMKEIWRDISSGNMLAKIEVPDCTDNTKPYLCHPVAIDAMIQAIMFNKNQNQDQPTGTMTLQVPISIGSFTWIASQVAGNFYIYVPEGKALSQAFLVGDDFQTLAAMEGVELVSTTIQAIDTALCDQKSVLPAILEEIWTAASNLGDVNVTEQIFTLENKLKITNEVMNREDVSDDEKYEHSLLDELVTLYTQIAFSELGYKSQPGKVIDLDDFCKTFKIKKEFHLFVGRLFEILSEDGYFTRVEEMKYEQKKEILAADVCLQKIKRNITQGNSLKLAFEVANLVMPKLAKVLVGESSVLQELFGEGDKAYAERVYTEDPICIRSNEIAHGAMRHIFKTHLEKIAQGKQLRILEIGAGTGGTTGAILSSLRDSQLNFTYTFTDLSAMFFNRAEQNFPQYKDVLKYKVLDIATDPRDQGFLPNHYDIIVAANVLHATKSIEDTLGNVRLLAKTGAILMIVEHFSPQRVIDGCFGLLEGYWMFEDFHVRPNHALMSEHKWMSSLEKTGFGTSFPLKTADETAGIILAQATAQEKETRLTQTHPTKKWVLITTESSRKFNEKIIQDLSKLWVDVQSLVLTSDQTNFQEDIWKARYLNREDINQAVIKSFGELDVEGFIYCPGFETLIDQSAVALPYFNLIQSLIKNTPQGKLTPKLVVVTQGTYHIGDQEPQSTGSGTLMGMSRTYKSEYPLNFCRTVDLDTSLQPETQVSHIISEMWQDDFDYFVAYRQGIRHTVQLHPVKLKTNQLSLPNSNRFCLRLPSTRAINDLTFIPSAITEIKDNQVEIQVEAAALNFRDVFAVLKPDEQFTNINAVGTDFAGIITRIGKSVTRFAIGDAVMSCAFTNEALPSHRISKATEVVKLPPSLTFAEAATLPAVFATAYHCLVDVAKLKKGEKILVHTASGGVGLVAIQIAANLGAEIFTTAGNRRKRAYLRSLGVNHVFHSRNTDYEQQILRITEGKGVDVILNSLTGPGFKEASLKCLGKKGRFIEMSKLNVWSNEEVYTLRPDVNYQIVDLTSVSEEVNIHLNDNMSEEMNMKRVVPIPYTKFNCVNIREALTCLQRAKHIGKVVITMPKMTQEHGVWVSKQMEFNDRSTYMITGGLGGIGLEAAKWMASEGAKYIVLCGRSQPSEKAVNIIQELNQQGKCVKVVSGDVGKINEVTKIFDQIENEMPSLRGIMHAAGCISDALYPDQTWEKFQKTFNAKITGTWNLHNVTLQRKYRLEHFVLYSSMVASFGSMGQSNHAAGNSFMDSFANYRNAIGLPATSVNWGQWGQVGVAADIVISSITPFTPKQGFAALKYILNSQKIQAAVVEADFDKLKFMYRWMQKSYGIHLKSAQSTSQSNNKIKETSSEEFWKTMDSTESSEDKKLFLMNVVQDLLRGILKYDSTDTIDVHQNFQDVGLDSLMMVELKNGLQSCIGGKFVLTASDLADCNTVHLITEKLMSMLFGEKQEMSRNEYISALKEISKLTVTVDDKAACSSKNIKTVLVVGSQSIFGKHVVEALLNNSRISKIYCLQAENLPSDNTTTIIGDPALNKLGLSEGDYSSLCTEVDAIIHCEAKYSSGNSKTSQFYYEDIQKIKKEGLQNLIQFAAIGKIKQIFYTSFLFPEGKGVQGCGVLPERLSEESDISNYMGLGYVGSRFVAERLLNQAVSKGIPCKLFRLPYTAGNSKNGEFSIQDENHVFLKYVKYMVVGMMPNVPIPFTLLPIDFCVDITLKVFLEYPDSPSGAFNVTNPHKYSMKDFFQVSEEYGKPVKSVEFQDFMKEVEKDGENSLLRSIRETYGDPVADDAESKETYKRLAASSHDFNCSERIQQIIPNYEELAETPLDILKRDLKFAHNSGLFQKYVL